MGTRSRSVVARPRRGLFAERREGVPHAGSTTALGSMRQSMPGREDLTTTGRPPLGGPRCCCRRWPSQAVSAGFDPAACGAAVASEGATCSAAPLPPARLGAARALREPLPDDADGARGRRRQRARSGAGCSRALRRPRCGRRRYGALPAMTGLRSGWSLRWGRTCVRKPRAASGRNACSCSQLCGFGSIERRTRPISATDVAIGAQLLPSEDHASSFARIRPTTSVVNSVVPAWPPRSGVLVPAAVASSEAS